MTAKKQTKKESKKSKPTTPAPVRAQDRNKFEVGKVGWDAENPFVPIICLDKKVRQELGVEEKAMVYVKTDAHKVLAVVQIQFWDLVGTRKCTLNNKLAQALDVNIGEKVEIDTDAPQPDATNTQRQAIRPAGIVVVGVQRRAKPVQAVAQEEIRG
jgi:hypothetical protein